MLLTKKIKFSVEEARIKRDILSREGECMVKINLRYPEIKCGKKDPLGIFAKKLYPDLANAFAKYAESELLEAATAAMQKEPEGFLPFSAVMKYEITYCDESFLSLLIEMSVSKGRDDVFTERKAQVWEREYGTKCRASYFLPKGEMDKFLKEKLTKSERKKIDTDNFILKEQGLEFFIAEGDGVKKITIPFLQKNRIKVTE